MRLLHLVVLLFCGCLCHHSSAAELPDPWADLRPAHAVRCLVALRPVLDATPDDQRALGCAIGAYVALCLNAHPEYDGAFGPWLGYAHTLVDRRRTARGGAPTTTLTAAAPELWLRLIDGDAIGVLAELDRLPPDLTSSHGVALRALASSDWRPLAASQRRDALIDYARMVLFHRTLARNVARDVEDFDLIDPYVARRSYWARSLNAIDAKTLPGEAVAGIGLLLRAGQIDDATAKTEAGQLLDALGAKLDPLADRGQVVAAVMEHARRMEPGNALALTVAERIALAHSDGPCGILDAHGRHLLIGVGDVAAWVRSRLLDASYFAFSCTWQRASGPPRKKFEECDKILGAAVRKELPDALLTAEVSTGFDNLGKIIPQPAIENLAKAITRERSRAHPLPDRQLVASIAKLAYHRPDLAKPIIAEVFAHWTRSEDLHSRTGMKALLAAAWRCGLDADLATVARTLVRHRPADVELRGYADVFDPQQRLSAWSDLPPTTTWTGGIDAAKRQFPQLRHPESSFAISWDGWLRIETTGDHQFQVVSTGCFKTVIGDLTLTYPRSTMLFPDLPIRTSGSIRISQAGWIPLWFDYQHNAGEPECRLLWKPPGAETFTPIPLTLLAHGPEHAPGLSARAIEGRQARTAFAQVTGVAEPVFAWATTLPWHTDLIWSLGTSAIGHRQFHQMLPVARAGDAVNPAANPSTLLTCHLMQGGADLDAALERLRTIRYSPGDFPQQRLLVSRLREERRLEQFALVMQKQLQGRDRRYLNSLVCLPLGRFAEMQPEFTDAIGDASLWIVDSELRPLCLLAIAVNRMYGKPPPEFKRLIEQAGIPEDHQGYQVAADALAGLNNPAAVAELSPWNQELVRWAEAVLDFSEGNHEQAKATLTVLTTNANGDPAIAELGRDLLAWYATQTIETLATLPKALPVKRRAVGTAKPGANDF